MYLDINTKKKIPGAYILLNSKFENSYIIVLKALKKILTCEDSVKLNVYSITLDFKEALMNAVNKVFPKIRIVGCLFHYVKQIRLKLGKYGLLTQEYLENSNILLKELSTAPFTLYKNKDFITDTFEKIIKLSTDENHTNLLMKFKNYFKNTWNKYFKNNIPNYKNLNREQRCNSYIENYNKRIRHILGKFIYLIIYNIGIFLNRKGISIIPWPLFLSFIFEEEAYYKNLLLYNDNKFINKPDITNINDNYIGEEMNAKKLKIY